MPIDESPEIATDAEPEAAPVVVEKPAPAAPADTSIRASLEAAAARAAPADKPAAEAAPKEDKPAPAEGRDEKGRFAPKEKPAEPEAKAEGITAPAVAIGKPAADLKPPQSWKPLEREAFAKAVANPEMRTVLEAAVRREREVQGALQASAPAKQFHDEFQARVVQPYAALFSARGVPPGQMVTTLLDRENRFQFAPPAQKAVMLAEIFKASGATLDQLAAAIDGQAPAAGAQPFDPAALLAQARAEMRKEFQTQQQTQQQSAAAAKVQAFLATTPEFFEDVKEDVADRMELAARRGIDLSIEQAYDKACREDAQIGPIIRQREASKKAATEQSATQRARAAASSVKSRPGGEAGSAPAGDSIRAHLEAAAAAARRQ